MLGILLTLAAYGEFHCAPPLGGGLWPAARPSLPSRPYGNDPSREESGLRPGPSRAKLASLGERAPLTAFPAHCRRASRVASATLFRKGSAGTKTEAGPGWRLSDCHVKERFTQIRARMILDQEVCEPGTTYSPPSRRSAKRSSGRGRTTTRLSLPACGISTKRKSPTTGAPLSRQGTGFLSVRSFVCELKGPLSFVA